MSQQPPLEILKPPSPQKFSKYRLPLEASIELKVKETMAELEKYKIEKQNKYQYMLAILNKRNTDINKADAARDLLKRSEIKNKKVRLDQNFFLKY